MGNSIDVSRIQTFKMSNGSQYENTITTPFIKPTINRHSPFYVQAVEKGKKRNRRDSNLKNQIRDSENSQQYDDINVDKFNRQSD